MPSLPQDKANHALYGALIFLLALAILRRPDAAYALVVLAAVGKEVLDWLSNQRAIRAGLTPTHGVEWFDARELWTAVKELRSDLARLSVELPKTYVTRDDYRSDLKEIRDLLGRIFDKLDGKVDRS
jgi:hypothetical protein